MIRGELFTDLDLTGLVVTRPIRRGLLLTELPIELVARDDAVPPRRGEARREVVAERDDRRAIERQPLHLDVEHRGHRRRRCECSDGQRAQREQKRAREPEQWIA